MYNRILAPLDGSKLSECSLSHIKEIASGCKVPEVIILTVIEPIQYPAWWPTNESQIKETMAAAEENWKQTRLKAEEYLSGISQDLRKAGISAQAVVLEEKAEHKTADLILDYARDNNVDLIVMSTHGRSGVSRWAFGSVTDKIVRQAIAPVLTITPGGCRVS